MTLGPRLAILATFALAAAYSWRSWYRFCINSAHFAALQRLKHDRPDPLPGRFSVKSKPVTVNQPLGRRCIPSRRKLADRAKNGEKVNAKKIVAG
jgi:hypothetical protein